MGPWSDTGFGRTQGGNMAPLIDLPEDGDDRLVRQVAENAPAGAPVDAPITATDSASASRAARASPGGSRLPTR